MPHITSNHTFSLWPSTKCKCTPRLPSTRICVCPQNRFPLLMLYANRLCANLLRQHLHLPADEFMCVVLPLSSKIRASKSIGIHAKPAKRIYYKECRSNWKSFVSTGERSAIRNVSVWAHNVNVRLSVCVFVQRSTAATRLLFALRVGKGILTVIEKDKTHDSHSPIELNRNSNES